MPLNFLPNGMVLADPLKCQKCGNMQFRMDAGKFTVARNLVILLDPPEFVRLIARDFSIVNFTLICEQCGCQCATKQMAEVGRELIR